MSDAPPSKSKAVRVVVAVVALCLAAMLPLVVRTIWEGRAELVEADRAALEGRPQEEIIHLGRAARWRMPLARHDDEALARLMVLGETHEKVGKRELALDAYRETRRAIYATRGFSIPHPETLKRANARIATLMAEQERDFGRFEEGVDPAEALEERRKWHLAKLEAPVGPDPVGSRLSAIAFVGWIVCGVGFVLRGLDAHGRLRVRSAVRWGIGCLLLMVAWMVLLRWPGPLP